MRIKKKKKLGASDGNAVDLFLFILSSFWFVVLRIAPLSPYIFERYIMHARSGWVSTTFIIDGAVKWFVISFPSTIDEFTNYRIKSLPFSFLQFQVVAR